MRTSFTEYVAKYVVKLFPHYWQERGLIFIVYICICIYVHSMYIFSIYIYIYIYIHSVYIVISIYSYFQFSLFESTCMYVSLIM